MKLSIPDDIVSDKDLIKVHVAGSNNVPGETVWAIPFGNNKAIINNVPLTDKFSLHDIVEVSGNNRIKEFVKLLKKVNNTFYIKYEVGKTDAETTTKFQKLCKILESKSLQTEGMFKGSLSIAAPVDISDENVSKLIEESAEEAGVKIS